MRTALTIAGSDSGGGAGIQADLKTFAAHGVFGTSAVTAVTAQNTRGVTMVEPLSPAIVGAQIKAVALDLEPAATKIGMLAGATIAATVADAILEFDLANVVLDPVMISKSRATLLDDDAIEIIRGRLLGLAVVVTPNIPEAQALTGRVVTSVQDMRSAAKLLIEMGARNVVVKGGHLDGPAIDLLFNGRDFIELRADRIDSRHTHGTGCTFSSAIAARLALGDDLEPAVRAAKAYVTRAIAQAPCLGAGHGPLQHFPK
jgi:hydroxymethylpyrimidine/phosphomethylpyrimidine kinase